MAGHKEKRTINTMVAKQNKLIKKQITGLKNKLNNVRGRVPNKTAYKGKMKVKKTSGCGCG